MLLVAANLVPLFGVLAWNWPLFPVLAIFWFETIVIGAMAALRILFAYPTSLIMWFVKLMCSAFLAFLLIPYGMLLVILTFFVFGVFASREVGHALVSIVFAASDARDLLTLDEAGQVLWREIDAGMLLAAAALTASHLFSFVRYYLIAGECNRVGLRDLVAKPVARIWLMLAVVNAGAFGLLYLEAPQWLLVPLIGVKTALDLHAHLREHRLKAA